MDSREIVEWLESYVGEDWSRRHHMPDQSGHGLPTGFASIKEDHNQNCSCGGVYGWYSPWDAYHYKASGHLSDMDNHLFRFSPEELDTNLRYI